VRRSARLAAIASTIAFCSAAVAQTAPRPDPIAVARSFYAALDRDDAAVGALLTADAMIVAGDVGGPLTGDLARQLLGMAREHCRQPGFAPAERPSPDPGVTIIVARYHCVSSEHPEGYDVALELFVRGERIAGVYFP
jgi:hypothetical protein